MRAEPFRMLDAHWHIACRARGLRRRPRAVTLLGRHLVVFRARDGRYTALEDRCLHRNMMLSRGRVTEHGIQCPYHGWCYNAAGAVSHIPAHAHEPELCENLRISSYSCLEQDGYVWVSLAPKPASARPRRFPHLGEPGWTSFRMQTRFHAPVEACLENFLDCPHAVYVHRGWFRYPTVRRVRAEVRTLHDGAVAEYIDEPRERSLVWSLLSSKRARMEHRDRFIVPHTSEVDYVFSDRRAYVITSVCTQVEDAVTDVYTVISFRFGAIAPLVRLVFEPLARVIIRQDVRILAWQQENVTRFGQPAFTNTRADLLGRHIYAWRRALRQGGPPPVMEQERHVDLCL